MLAGSSLRRVAILGGYFDDNAGDQARAAVRAAAAALGARETVVLPMAAAFARAGYVNFERQIDMTWLTGRRAG